MKTSDIAMIVLIASFSVMIAFFVASSLPFLKVDEQSEKVQTIELIPSEIAAEYQPSAKIFNEAAVNPTVKTVVGKND